jgi:DNA-binding response OmpR family regulator
MRNVLIVEDEAVMRSELRGILKEVPDIKVDEAPDAKTARQLMSLTKYEIALVDIKLGPGVMDQFAGMQIIGELREQGCIPLIVSGTGDDTLRGVTATMWGYDFLNKPVVPVDLLNKVNSALDLAARKHTGKESENWPLGLTEKSDEPGRVYWHSKPVNLSLIGYRLVCKLADSPGKVVTNAALIKAMKSGNSTSALASHLSTVRGRFREVDKEFGHIKSKGGGYCWTSE